LVVVLVVLMVRQLEQTEDLEEEGHTDLIRAEVMELLGHQDKVMMVVMVKKMAQLWCILVEAVVVQEL
jgi:hypothetical protein